MPGYGYQNFFGFAAETTWGTLITPTIKFVELVKGGDRLKSDQKLLISAGTNELSIHKSRKVRRGALDVGGEVEFEIPYQGAELLFKHSFGKVTTTGLGPYTHVFTLSPADWLALVGLSLESRVDHASANSFFYEGGIPTKIGFSVSADNFWKAVITFAAEDETVGTPSTPTFPAAPLATFYDDTTGSTLTFNAAGYEITDFSVDLDLGVNTNRRGLGSRLIKKPVPGGNYNCTGRFKATFENANAYNDFRAATERVLTIKSVGDTITGGNYSIQLDVAVAVLTAGRPTPADQGIIYSDYAFQGFYDGTSRELKLTLINSQAGPI